MTLIPYDRAATQVARSNVVGFNADWLLDPAEIANRIGGTDFVPKAIRNNPAAITAALLFGAEAGLGPMQSLAKIHVIDGRPTMAAEAQRALILAAGHELWIEESTNTRCTVAGRRRDSDTTSRVTWTLDDAKRAKIAGKPNWQAYPRQMLVARASAELARAIFADVIAGMAATEELEDDVDIADTPAIESEAPAKPTTRRRKRTAATIGGSSTASAPAPVPPAASDQVAKPEEPAPPADEAAPPDPPNQRALRRLFALFTEKGMNERDDRLAFAEKVIGHPLQTSNDLTALEASRIMEALEALPTAAEPEHEPPTFVPPAGVVQEMPGNEQAVLDDLERELGAHDAEERPPLPDDQP